MVKASCVLCRHSDFKTILRYDGVSMTSDSQIINIPLIKEQCAVCGLIRNAKNIEHHLKEFYEESYSLGRDANNSESIFQIDGKWRKRSELISEWFSGFINDKFSIRDDFKALEVGCGEGKVMQVLRHNFPCASFYGIEPNKESCKIAQGNGLQVEQGGYEDIKPTIKYNLIYSFAVLEHLPNPADFFKSLKKSLLPGGVIITAQPCQDIPSHDLYFVDHIYHFHSSHINQLAINCGYKVLRTDVEHPVIPAFSMQSFEADNSNKTGIDYEFPPNFNILENIKVWEEKIKAINALLKTEWRDGLCLWGVGETFFMFFNYSKLKSEDVLIGFDDNYSRYKGRYKFTVSDPSEEKIKEYRESPWLLTFSPHQNLRNKLHRLAINYKTLKDL